MIETRGEAEGCTVARRGKAVTASFFEGFTVEQASRSMLRALRAFGRDGRPKVMPKLNHQGVPFFVVASSTHAGELSECVMESALDAVRYWEEGCPYCSAGPALDGHGGYCSDACRLAAEREYEGMLSDDRERQVAREREHRSIMADYYAARVRKRPTPLLSPGKRGAA